MDLIYDWNEVRHRRPAFPLKVEFDDETLRDGIQSPSVKDPTIEQKLELLHLMDDLGITTANIGLPGAGKRAQEDVARLAREIRDHKMNIQANCACRTVEADIKPIVEVTQETGVPIEVYTFIGTSPIRQYAEKWDIDHICKTSEKAIRFAVDNNMDVAYVTEDTTRSKPSDLDKIFRNAIDCGARRLVLCDTVGHSTTDGATNLVVWTLNIIEAMGMAGQVKVDWHGHNDRGLGVVNAMAAARAGAHRIHGTALGVGERVGNAAMDQLLVNLKLLEVIDNDLTHLVKYCEKVSAYCEWPIPWNYPLAGRDAFRTATGVHASAIVKALDRDDVWLADRVYSGVPAHLFGKTQEIDIGHMSGRSNVKAWLKTHGHSYDDGLAQAILAKAKSTDHTLEVAEIEAVISAHQAS